MAGPRSLSRSTKVASPGGSRKNAKGKGKYNSKKKGAPPLATWDHDNSSADESADEEPAGAGAARAAASAGKKRPRVGEGASRAAEAGAKDRDGEEAGARKSSGGGSKRQRAEAGGMEEDGSASESGDEDDIGGGGGGEEEDGGGAAAGATPAGGMGDVMARILGQKLDSRVQVGKEETREGVLGGVLTCVVRACTAVAGTQWRGEVFALRGCSVPNT